ncbi:Serine/threonine-protein phosphatase 7 long form homolog [Linum perenne]
MRINYDLITALVERWKLETHTFHVPEGESIVILKTTSSLLD